MPYPGLMRPRSSGSAERWGHLALRTAFLLTWALVFVRQFPQFPWFEDASWPESTFLVAAVLVTVSSLALRISLQNAVMAAGVIGLVGGAAHWASYVTGVPFGPLRFPHAQGPSPLQEWFFVPACIWVVILLNARGLAGLILQPAVKYQHHGWHLLGLGALLTVVMAMALEPFASTVHRYWLWGETRLSVTWQNVPLSCLFAWGVISVIATFAATPFLIDKHPRPLPPPREAAWIWALLSAWFAVGTAIHQRWPATIAAALNGVMAVGIDLSVKRRRSRNRPVGTD